MKSAEEWIVGLGEEFCLECGANRQFRFSDKDAIVSAFIRAIQEDALRAAAKVAAGHDDVWGAVKDEADPEMKPHIETMKIASEQIKSAILSLIQKEG